MKSYKNIRIAKAGFFYTAGNILLRGLMFVTLPIFTRILNTSEFGIVNVFNSYAGILFVIVGVAIHSSIKNAKYDIEDFDCYVGNCAILIIVNSLIFVVLYNFVSIFYQEPLGLNKLEGNCLIIYSMSNALISLYNSKIALDYKYKKFLILSYVSSFINLFASFLFIYYFSSKTTGRIAGITLGSFFPALYIIYELLYKERSKISIRKDFLIYGLKISSPVVPHGLSQTVLSSFDRIIINQIVNSSSAGIYSLTYTISLIPQIVFSSLNNVWEPLFFEKLNNNDESIKKDVKFYTIIITLFFSMFVLVSPEIIDVIAAPQYKEAKDITIIVLMGIYFSTIYIIPCEFEYYYKKTKYLGIFTTIAAVLNVFLNYFTIKIYGYKAAAYTTLICYFLYFISHMITGYMLQQKKIMDIKFITLMVLFYIALCTFSFYTINMKIIRYVIFMLVLVIFISELNHFFKKSD